MTVNVPVPGISVFKRMVPPDVTMAALRRINLDVVERGLDADDLRAWATTTAFPHLRWSKEILACREACEELFVRDSVAWVDPQIMYRFPDHALEYPISYHIDQEDGKRFAGICCVPLTRAEKDDGCLIVKDVETGEPTFVPAIPGDLIHMSNWVEHAAGLNVGGNIRAALYFRYHSA